MQARAVKKETSNLTPTGTGLHVVFGNFANRLSRAAGSPYFFIASVALIGLWLVSGFFADFSESWRFAIHTGLTVCTFLMVIVLQNSQNRDGLALQIKLDEIIRAQGSAKNTMIDLEQLTQEELVELKAKFSEIAQRARSNTNETTLSTS